MNADARAQQAVPASLLGMILFITSETMFFGGLFAAYFSLRARTPAWPPEGIELETLLPGLATVLLVVSSLTATLAEASAGRGDRSRTLRWLAVTGALGSSFLAIQGYEYSTLDFAVSDGSFPTLFFTMTGFHGAHVAAGLVAFGVVALRIARGSSSHGPLTAAGYYWHFVDVVWIGLFATLYLLR